MRRFAAVLVTMLLISSVLAADWYQSPPGFHRHVTRDGRVIEHEDWNQNNPIAHREVQPPWWKYFGPRSPDQTTQRTAMRIAQDSQASWQKPIDVNLGERGQVSLQRAIVLVRDKTVPRWELCGVWISADGYFLTALHGVSAKRDFRVWVPDVGERSAQIVYRPKNAQDGPVIAKVEGVQVVNFVPLATVAPKKGDRVRYGGFPSAKSLAQYLEGTGVIKETVARPDHEGKWANVVEGVVIPGMSGGPLVNADGELIGILSGFYLDNPRLTVWVNWASISRAWSSVRSLMPALRKAEGAVLVVFKQHPCPPCDRFDDDRVAGLLPDLNSFSAIQFVDVRKNVPGTARAVRDFQAATGHKIRLTPTFWIKGTSHFKENYVNTAEGRAALCDWVNNILASIVDFFRRVFVGSGAYTPPPPQTGAPPPGGIVAPPSQVVVAPPITTVPGNPVEPELSSPFNEVPDPVPDPIDVPPINVDQLTGFIKCVVVCAKTTKNAVKGFGLKQLIERGEGPARQKLEEVFKGKVHFQLVTERVHANTYASITEVAGITPNPVVVLLYVGEMDLGAKGFLVGKLEAALQEWFPDGFPVKPFFKRVNAASYNAGLAALGVVESAAVAPQVEQTTASGELDPEKEEQVWSRLGNLIESKVRPLQQKLENGEHPAASKKDDGSGWLGWLFGGGGILGGGVWAWLQRKRAKLRDAIHGDMADLLAKVNVGSLKDKAGDVVDAIRDKGGGIIDKVKDAAGVEQGTEQPASVPGLPFPIAGRPVSSAPGVFWDADWATRQDIGVIRGDITKVTEQLIKLVAQGRIMNGQLQEIVKDLKDTKGALASMSVLLKNLHDMISKGGLSPEDQAVVDEAFALAEENRATIVQQLLDNPDPGPQTPTTT